MLEINEKIISGPTPNSPPSIYDVKKELYGDLFDKDFDNFSLAYELGESNILFGPIINDDLE